MEGEDLGAGVAYYAGGGRALVCEEGEVLEGFEVGTVDVGRYRYDVAGVVALRILCAPLVGRDESVTPTATECVDCVGLTREELVAWEPSSSLRYDTILCNSGGNVGVRNLTEMIVDNTTISRGLTGTVVASDPVADG